MIERSDPEAAKGVVRGRSVITGDATAVLPGVADRWSDPENVSAAAKTPARMPCSCPGAQVSNHTIWATTSTSSRVAILDGRGLLALANVATTTA